MRFFLCFIKSVLILVFVVEATVCGQAYDNDADINFSLFSNTGSGQFLADDFRLNGNFLINQVTWRGIYFTGDPNDPLVDDNFTIQIHGSDDVRPFTDAYTSDNVGVVSRINTGDTLEISGDDYDIYEYSASISQIGLTSTTRHWLSVSNDSSSPWSWAVESGSGVIRIRDFPTTPWNSSANADAAFTLDGTVVDLPDTSRWTAGDGYFDNPNNWDSGFSPASGSFGDERNAIIDTDASSPFEIRMRTGADLESLTLDSENASFFVGDNTLTVETLTLNRGLIRMGGRSTLNQATVFDPNGNYRQEDAGGLAVTPNWTDVDYHGNLKIDRRCQSGLGLPVKHYWRTTGDL